MIIIKDEKNNLYTDVYPFIDSDQDVTLPFSQRITVTHDDGEIHYGGGTWTIDDIARLHAAFTVALGIKSDVIANGGRA